MGKPKLTKEEIKKLKKIEHEAYMNARIQKAKREGKRKAESGSFAKSAIKSLGHAFSSMSKAAQEFDQKLEREMKKEMK